ncbi:MAG: ABC transporter ATP-binding protein [Chitinophagales bacterium]|nr:ABC transporter ATP-binding protein [Chitinophagales bacterium]
MQPVIIAQHISKFYRLGRRRSGSFRETLNDRFNSLLMKNETLAATEFRALNDVSFRVNAGEVMGIIGKNGAGKSTLLKILSRITAPTKGTVEIQGRVSSLLEVGTGFHPELTGRENIFMNGAILGMKRKEIKNKFDEIVAFAGIGQFLDTPVKRYSSGMYVRLAFAVAAHLEPEILIIDEVLAVGDAEFQKKCLGKMKSVSEQDGRTVLFVSHNMGAVARLCRRAMILEQGNIVFDGTSAEAIQQYHRSVNTADGNLLLRNRANKTGKSSYIFSDYYISDSDNRRVNTITTGSNVSFHVFLRQQQQHPVQAYITLSLKDSAGNRLLSLASGLYNRKISLSGDAEVIWTIERLQLADDDYSCDLYLFEADGGAGMIDALEDAFSVTVEEGDYFHSNMIQTRGRDKFFCEFKLEVREA